VAPAPFALAPLAPAPLDTVWRFTILYAPNSALPAVVASVLNAARWFLASSAVLLSHATSMDLNEAERWGSTIQSAAERSAQT
jgi:hypothetical protein